MAVLFVVMGMLVAVSAAPPSTPRHLYTQPGSPQLQHQQLNTLDYYLDNPEVHNYYNQAQQKQGAAQSNRNDAPSRLESLEPDSEVEILPGAQQPQQPPQQNPVNPNIPGLLPGQRVYIIHMPIPGYQPGTIGGYQPVYVVAASPSGQPNYIQRGYQNAILLDPSGQGLISPVLGYQRPGLVQQGGNPGFLVTGGQGQLPFAVNRPYDLLYQDPAAAAFGYQTINGVAPNAAGAGVQQGPVRFSQLVHLQQARPGQVPINPQAASSEKVNQPAEVTHMELRNAESKEVSEEQQRNSRPLPAHIRTLQKKA